MMQQLGPRRVDSEDIVLYSVLAVVLTVTPTVLTVLFAPSLQGFFHAVVAAIAAA